MTRIARYGRIVALAGQGFGVDDIHVQTGETYRTIATVLRAGPLARLAAKRNIEAIRAIEGRKSA
jgi:hypothetical protein